MIRAIMRWCMANRLLVMIAVLVLIVGGTLAVMNIPLEAIPDISPTQVIVKTSQETLSRILNTLQLRSDNLTRNQSHAHLFGALSQLP